MKISEHQMSIKEQREMFKEGHHSYKKEEEEKIPPNKYKWVGISLSESIIQEIDWIVESHHLSRSEVIENIIWQWFMNRERNT